MVVLGGGRFLMSEVPLYMNLDRAEKTGGKVDVSCQVRSVPARTRSWMGPPQGKRAPRVGPISIVILAREGTITD